MKRIAVIAVALAFGAAGMPADVYAGMQQQRQMQQRQQGQQQQRQMQQRQQRQMMQGQQRRNSETEQRAQMQILKDQERLNHHEGGGGQYSYHPERDILDYDTKPSFHYWY